VVATPDAAERVRAVYGPFHARLAELFTQYTADELTVLTDWFTRAGALARGYLDESC
jgi:N-formylglutamate amidohydrolase